jgi:hypothetical protein
MLFFNAMRNHVLRIILPSRLALQLHSFSASLVIKATDIQNDENRRPHR